MREVVENVYIDPDIQRYIVNLVGKTRKHRQVELGVSPRGSLALLKLSRAWAAIHERDYVIPDDVKILAPYALGHRIDPGSQPVGFEESRKSGDRGCDPVCSRTRHFPVSMNSKLNLILVIDSRPVAGCPGKPEWSIGCMRYSIHGLPGDGLGGFSRKYPIAGLPQARLFSQQRGRVQPDAHYD